MKKHHAVEVMVPMPPAIYFAWVKLHPRSRIVTNDGAMVTVRMTQAQYLAHRAGLLVGEAR